LSGGEECERQTRISDPALGIREGCLEE